MRQILALFFGILLADNSLGGVIVSQPHPDANQPGDPFVLPPSLDQSFHFTDTNFTAINAIELLPDGRIAFGGAAPYFSIGVASPTGSVQDPNHAGQILTNVTTLAVDPADRVIYSIGSPYVTDRVQRSLESWDDPIWAFQSDLRGTGKTILALPDRHLLVGGRLQVPGDTNLYGLVRLQLSGEIDRSFDYTTSTDFEVTSAAIMADGSILAAFQTTNESGLAYGYYRWESNGARNGLPLLLTDSRVSAMARMPGTDLILLAHEKIVEGQPQTTFSWVNENGVASGPSAEWPTVFGKVHSIAFETLSPETAQSGGNDRTIIAGEFTRVGTNDCNNLASLNKDGSVAWSFSANSGPDAPIHDLAVQLDGKILIAGSFTNVNGVEERALARIQATPESGNYLFWSDSHYTASETQGAVFLSLKRTGNVNATLIVNLSRDPATLPVTVNVPPQVVFGSGESELLVHVGIINNSLTSGRNQLQITATTSNTNIISSRSTTTLFILDDETAGTVDPNFKPAISPFRSIFAIQPDGKIIFGGNGTNLERLNPDGTPDPTFVTKGVPDLFGGSIHQILPQPDGTIYIAGDFSTTNSYGINNVVRLYPSGAPDRTFDPKLTRTLSFRPVKTHVLAGGDLLIWLPTSVSRLGELAGLLRLDKSGNVIRSFQAINKWSNEPVWEVSDAEEIFTYGATFPYRIQKYSSAGAPSTNFPTTEVAGRLFTMRASANALFVGGDFTMLGTNAVTNLAKLDIVTGAPDTNFNAVVNGTVLTLTLHSSKIYITGDFTEVNGQPCYRVARLNLDGSLDSTFNPGLGPNRAPNITGVQIDGSLIIGNGFSRVDGIAITPFARLVGDPNSGEIRFVSRIIEVNATNQFATVEVERVGGSWGQISGIVYTVEGSALESQHYIKTNFTVTYLDGELGRKQLHIPLSLLGQAFQPITFSVVLKTFETSDETTVLIPRNTSRVASTISATGSTNVFRDIAVDPTGWIYAVGSFTNVATVPITNIVRLSPWLDVDESFRPASLPAQITGGATNHFTPIRTVAVNEDGILIGGAFSLLDNSPIPTILRLTHQGEYDTSFNATVRSTIPSPLLLTANILHQPNGKIVAQTGGTLGFQNSIRFSRDGAFDATWNESTGGEFQMDQYGRMYVRNSSSVTRVNTNGYTDIFSVTVRSFVPAPTPNLEALAIQADDKVLLGGNFTHVGATVANVLAPRLARVLTNRVVDTNFVAVVGTNASGSLPKNRVTAIQPLPTGDILIGGFFDIVNGQRRNMLALLTTNGELRNDFEAEVVGEQIDQFALLPDGDVVVRGRVSTVDGIEVGNLFKLDLPDIIPPVAKFLWPTNGAEVRVTDTQEFIQVHAFDPDGIIERAVLELNGQPIATNNSGNIPFEVFLPLSGQHQLRLTVTDNSGLSATESVTFTTIDFGLPQHPTIIIEGDELIITYQHGRLLESTDLQTWTEVHAGGGQYRTTPSSTHRFYAAGVVP